ncbi:MAG: hypothetical protein US50_C0001G0031 [Candidatus Nomurabacteria bacterium GW2011_GWB1_37_5]|uniref:Uncharacterized protein n=1 Tax=Candidatus Nomurabacteria bacterium GW2011_GWB1_37_5 TaxID=1618742 RepID=A0A0G0JGZ5_9BACT|nr:MAG: hypothetical protein US50_C0001G0031 [Candidatus Nomurabacteria bacterium GW2011_GWB1_37_5]
MKNKWKGLEGRGYRLQNLGRPAIFLLPIKKLKKKVRGQAVEKTLHKFLIEEFGAYTSSTIPNFGIWENIKKMKVSDKCRQYEVSFVGKKRIPILLEKLAEIAGQIGEDCIYFKAGQYTTLVYPAK